MPDAYALVRPLLFRLPPERAHRAALCAVEAGLDRLLLGRAQRPKPPILAQSLWGREFPNPIILAAGFDKMAGSPMRWGAGVSALSKSAR
jgi:dihydroorotate dehydrogenase